MARCFTSRILSLCLLGTSVFARDLTIRGFVTAVNSPTSFVIDDYKITRDKALSIDLDNPQGGSSLVTFKPDDIRVGTELEVNGEYDETSCELKAKALKVFTYDTVVVKRTALLERLPSLSKSESGWTGVIDADGERITVSPATAVSLKPNHAERMSAVGDTTSAAGKFSPDSLNLDTFVHYEGVRQSDGTINAQKVEFEHVEIGNGEARMWRRFTPTVTGPDYANFQPGDLKIGWKSYKIVPSREAQEFISKLGNSLVPDHQRQLPDGDPRKISFRFFLVENGGFNALTYPNGVIVVYSGLFDVLENEAQLAFVLSHEISHVVEKHAWQQNEYYRSELIALREAGGLVPGGLRLGNLQASSSSIQYARTLENQSDRVALEWMLAAGYDIREAPQSWRAVSKKKTNSLINPFWATRDNYTSRRSYLIAELRNNYRGVNYSNLKKDSSEFHHVANLVHNFENGQKQKTAVAGE
jgi:cold shock CspA family protein